MEPSAFNAHSLKASRVATAQRVPQSSATASYAACSHAADICARLNGDLRNMSGGLRVPARMDTSAFVAICLV